MPCPDASGQSIGIALRKRVSSAENTTIPPPPPTKIPSCRSRQSPRNKNNQRPTKLAPIPPQPANTLPNSANCATYGVFVGYFIPDGSSENELSPNTNPTSIVGDKNGNTLLDFQSHAAPSSLPSMLPPSQNILQSFDGFQLPAQQSRKNEHQSVPRTSSLNTQQSKNDQQFSKIPALSSFDSQLDKIPSTRNAAAQTTPQKTYFTEVDSQSKRSAMLQMDQISESNSRQQRTILSKTSHGHLTSSSRFHPTSFSLKESSQQAGFSREIFLKSTDKSTQFSPTNFLHSSSIPSSESSAQQPLELPQTNRPNSKILSPSNSTQPQPAVISSTKLHVEKMESSEQGSVIKPAKKAAETPKCQNKVLSPQNVLIGIQRPPQKHQTTRISPSPCAETDSVKQLYPSDSQNQHFQHSSPPVSSGPYHQGEETNKSALNKTKKKCKQKSHKNKSKYGPFCKEILAACDSKPNQTNSDSQNCESKSPYGILNNFKEVDLDIYCNCLNTTEMIKECNSAEEKIFQPAQSDSCPSSECDEWICSSCFQEVDEKFLKKDAEPHLKSCEKTIFKESEEIDFPCYCQEEKEEHEKCISSNKSISKHWKINDTELNSCLPTPKENADEFLSKTKPNPLHQRLYANEACVSCYVPKQKDKNSVLKNEQCLEKPPKNVALPKEQVNGKTISKQKRKNVKRATCTNSERKNEENSNPASAKDSNVANLNKGPVCSRCDKTLQNKSSPECGPTYPYPTVC